LYLTKLVENVTKKRRKTNYWATEVSLVGLDFMNTG